VGASNRVSRYNERVIIEQDARESLIRDLVSDGGDGGAVDAGLVARLHAALTSDDVAALEEPLRAIGRAVGATGRPLAPVVDAWESLVVALDAEPRVAVRGAAWVVQGYAEAKRGRDGDSLRETADSLASRKAELSALHRVNAAANSTLDERAMLSLVVQVVAEVSNAAVCSIYLLEPPRSLVLAATKGLNPDAVGHARMALGEGITGWAARERCTMAVADIWRDHRSNYLPETDEEGFHAIVSVPIVNRSLDRLIGVLNVQTVEAREFEDDEVAFLEMVSGELALAIENARSYELADRQLHRKVEELTALRRVIAMVVSSLEVQRVLDNIAEGAVTLVEADASAIVVVDGPDGDRTRMASCYGIPGGQDQIGRLGDGPVNHALETGRPVLVPDIPARRLGPGGDDVALRHGFHSLFLVPFQGRHYARGALCVYARSYRSWMREEVDLVAAFANEAALALENAALFEEAQRGLATKSVLLSELHHRVKNNLQTVASLLSLGLRHATGTEARQVLEESRSRVQSIAAVHDLLSQGNVGLTTVAEVARKVAEVADLQGQTPNRKIHFTVEGERILLATQQATTLAIALNELLTNTLRHAFAGRNEGHVAITYGLSGATGDTVELTVADDGVGLRPGFDPETHKGLGLSIVDALTRQDLRGTLSIAANEGGGTIVALRFPAAPLPSDEDEGA